MTDIEKVIKLDTYLNGDKPRVRSSDGALSFDWSAPMNKDEGELYLEPATGKVALGSWNISGHNGDPYGYTKEVVQPEKAAGLVKDLIQKLFARAKVETERRARKAADLAKDRALDDATRLAVGFRS